ncbi:MAG: sodium:calcium antiporter [Candidatus Methylomirabilales bacterium]
MHRAEAGKRQATQWLWMGLAVGGIAPGLLLRLGLFGTSDPLAALIYGAAVVASAFLLSWAAEAAQVDFSQGLALALLALIAILPEYVVDGTMAWLAATEPQYGGYAVANMTGANRLLVGIAWPLVVAIAFLRFGKREVRLEEGHGLELVVLLGASLYALVLPLTGNISLVDLVVLFAIFAFYMVRLAQLPAERPHLVGPARLVGSLPPLPRRLLTAALGLVAAVAILLVAKPFAKALVATGVSLGIDEFLLVQWLAPLASEAPEFLVVALFAWRGQSTPAFGTLVSSKINQWTLLVGMLPLVYSIASGTPAALPLDERQRWEVVLTAAQSVYALILILDLQLHLLGATSLLGLFLVQLLWPDTRELMSSVYVVLTLVVLARSWRRLGPAFRALRR